MHISSYFKPVPLALSETVYSFPGKHLGNYIKTFYEAGSFPDLEGLDIALIGIEEDRNAVNNRGCGMAAESIREFLYQLLPGNYAVKIADLGDIIRGNSVEDSYFAITEVVENLLGKKVLPVLMGGGQDATFAMYRSYKNLKQIINITAVDSLFDLGETIGELNSRSYLSHIILHKPSFLFNFSNIGYQTYFADPAAIDLMRNLYFDISRLGVLHNDITLAEPLIRDADLLSFDISAIRQSDAPGNANATPNGFFGDEACQIMRYAGMSDKITSMGLFELNPTLDRNGQTAHLAAQMIWYFIDGFYHREKGSPVANAENYIRYNVQVSDVDEGIVFYKSKTSERWWMELKCAENVREKYKRHYVIPCSANDYAIACENEIPDRWWQGYQKLM